jgi:glycosyltransferase involved in cell wall biosynthesis
VASGVTLPAERRVADDAMRMRDASPGRRVRRVCFFAKVADPALLSRVEFYAQDLRILAELGYDVRIVTRLRDLRAADLYFVWWWTWAFAPLWLAKLLRVPAIVTGVLDLPWWDPRPGHQKWLMRAALRGADANVFCSEMEFRAVPARLPTRAPRYVPLSVDTARYAPDGSAEEPIVLSVGWLQAGNAERKGMYDVVRAAPLVHAVHPGIRFVIAGEHGTGYPDLLALARSLGAEEYVSFPGAVSADEKIRLMRRCAVYLQPSRHEGFGVAILEALSCGAAVVTRAAGAVGEVVGDAAQLVRGDAPEDVARAVLEVLGDDRRRAELRRRGRERALSTYTYARRRDAIASLIAEVTTR